MSKWVFLEKTRPARVKCYVVMRESLSNVVIRVKFSTNPCPVTLTGIEGTLDPRFSPRVVPARMGCTYSFPTLRALYYSAFLPLRVVHFDTDDLAQKHVA